MQSNLEQLLWGPREVVPTFLAPGTGFVEDQGVGDCSGRIKSITSIVYFILCSYYHHISSTSDH